MADQIRRGVLKGAAAVGAYAAVRSAAAQGRSDDGPPRELDGKAMPEPPAERSAGPIRPGRGSMLQDKVAVVTGAARGIGRAIAVEMAANGADVVAIDGAGKVSPASNAEPATPEELDRTVEMIKSFGRRSEGIKADIRDIAALRQIADRIEQNYGKIDIVVANAAIQRWMPLDAGFRLARRDRQQSEWHRQYRPGLRAKNGRPQEGPVHPVVFHAGQARHQGRVELLRLQMGHPRPDEVSCHGVRRAQHHGERAHPRPRRHRSNSLRKASQRIDG